MPTAESGAQRLESTLGAPLPEGVRRLEPRHLEHLATTVREARRRQAAELAAAGERSLRFVPRLLRGPLRKVLG